MGTSYGNATDWLVATLPDVLTAEIDDALVIDGDGIVTSKALVIIGRTSDTNANSLDGDQSILTMGAGRVDEDYDIPCLITVDRPGPALKKARDDALTLFDAVAHTIATDRTLGGALLGGRYAQIEKVSISQSGLNTQQPAAERSVWVSFVVHCQSHYQP